MFHSWNYEFHTDIFRLYSITCITCWQNNSSVIWMLFLQIGNDCWCTLNQRGFSNMSTTSLNLSASHIWCRDQLYSWGQIIWFTGVDQTERETMILDRTNLQGTMIKATLSLHSISTVCSICTVQSKLTSIKSAQSNLHQRRFSEERGNYKF